MNILELYLTTETQLETQHTWNQPRRHVNTAAKPCETHRRDTPMRRSGDGVFCYDDSGLIFEGEQRERERGRF